MKERLVNAITLHAMQGFVPGTLADDSERQSTETGVSGASNSPSVFISYAWESEDLKKWVLELAKHLRSNGINVTLDRWHLGMGDNRFQFMEKSVTRSDFVLVIGTPIYAEKSEQRSGGVGYESNIITSRIAERVGKQKFIPVLRLGDWSTSVPAWLKFAVGCDLRGEPYSSEQFRDLLKTLHGKNASAPALGPTPSFEDEPGSRAFATDDAVVPLSPLFDLPDELTVKEHELLDAAVNDPDEQITFRKSNGHEMLLANGKSFLESGSRRSRAGWLAALRALEHRGLIEPTSAERSLYQVTDGGYKLSDRLGKFVRWRTKEIALRALYMNAAADSITIKCSGVVEIPATFYPDNVGADGTAIRSLKQDRSLWVEGVERGVTDGIRWEPTDASFISFINEESGELVEFRIRGLRPGEPGSFVLETAS
jgi:hypothetical protein